MKKQSRCLIYKISIICFLSAFLFACGYSFAPRGESIDNRIQKVYVDSFENRTAQAGIENYVRTAFVNQFIQNSRFKIASSAESADAIVRGKILNLHTSPLSHLKNDLAAEERATMIMEVVFEDKANGKVIWSLKDITDSVDYALHEDINLLPSTRRQALTKLANDMAEEAFNLMMSGF
ncbi:MAG: LptE family protein [Syntrophaceae bacterium]|nr:LptE family protein [Syntrophaceae bacterium]